MFEIANENYKELLSSLGEMLSIIKDFNILEINNEKLKIEYFLSSDYKMLLNLYGHKGSNSKRIMFMVQKKSKRTTKHRRKSFNRKKSR